MNVNRLLLPLAILTLVSSCGKSNSNAGFPEEEMASVTPLDGSNINGLYMATLMTLNPAVNGNIPGTVVVHRQGEKFQVFVKITGGGSGTWHQQNIHIGTRCPLESDDMNGDGLIDIVEGNRIWGKVVIPLDNNLSSQDAGKNKYPQGDENGNYFYERFTNFDTLFRDLKSTDSHPEDNIMKLTATQGFDLRGKVVVIHGAAQSANLPGTIASEGSYRANQTFPIACGEFQKITKMPDDIQSGQAPGPVGDSDVQPTPPPEEPTPTPTPTPSEPRPDGEENDDNDESEEWYDRLSDWWRRRF